MVGTATRCAIRRLPPHQPQMGTNTTLVVVMTNARLTKLDAYRLAQNAPMTAWPSPSARRIWTHEGDTAFALATEQVRPHLQQVASAATEMVAEAIRNAVRHARSLRSHSRPGGQLIVDLAWARTRTSADARGS